MPCRPLAIFLLGVLLTTGCHRGPNPEPVFLGHIAPFSGPDKEIGEHAKQAIALAVEEINQEPNRILGRTINVLHPSYPPEEIDKLEFVAVRLITVNRVHALLGGTHLNQVELLERATQAYEVPLVAFAGLPLESPGPNVFSVNVGLAFEGQTLARFARQELKVEHVAILVDGRERAATTLADAFAREFSKTNTSHVNPWSYKNPSDLSELVERFKKAQPGAILHAGSVIDLGRLRAKLLAAGIKVHVLFGGDEEHLALDQEAGNGVYVTMPYVAGAAFEENHKFVKSYQERYHLPPDAQAALAFDGMRVLFEAMRRGKSFKSADIRAALADMASTPFDKSLTGSWTFDNNHAARRPLFVGKLENGVLVNPKTYPPETK